MRTLAAAAIFTLSLVSCAPGPNPPMGGGTPRPGTPDISNAGAASQGMPQSPNSLPPGDRVNAPLTSPAGTVATTRFR